MALSPESGKRLVSIARHSLEAAVARRTVPDPEKLPEDLERPSGAFVTVFHQGALRGCLGRLEADQPLGKIVARLAASAATEDPRFREERLAPQDLPGVSLEVSVLSPLTRARAEEVVTGRHGILVKRGRRSGCFLPQVAAEHGWDRERFLSVCCQDKAGLAPDAWKDPATEIWVFTSESFS